MDREEAIIEESILEKPKGIIRNSKVPGIEKMPEEWEIEQVVSIHKKGDKNAKILGGYIVKNSL